MTNKVIKWKCVCGNVSGDYDKLNCDHVGYRHPVNNIAFTAGGGPKQARV